MRWDDLPAQCPNSGKKLFLSGYLSTKNDPVIRRPFPVDPGHLVAGLGEFHRLRLAPRGRTLLVNMVITGIVIVTAIVPVEGRLGWGIELSDLRGAFRELSRCVYLVHGLTGGLVNQGGTEARVSGE